MALSELPANWPGRFSQKGWLGLASQQITLKGLMFFFSLFSLLYFIFYLFFEYETIVSKNGLPLGYSERDTSSVQSVSFIGSEAIFLGT